MNNITHIRRLHLSEPIPSKMGMFHVALLTTFAFLTGLLFAYWLQWVWIEIKLDECERSYVVRECEMHYFPLSS